MIHIAIGDIHGCLNELKALTEKLSSYQNRVDEIAWVFLGDYCDRGPDTKGVVDFLHEFMKTNYCIFLKGNHEDLLLDEWEQRSWWRNGGTDTMNSYKDNSFRVEDSHKAFFRKCHKSYSTDKYFFCHAGVHPSYSLNDQLEQDLLWIRGTFLKWPDKFEKIIVHGHTVESEDKPVVKHNRINLDTGCVFGGYLTAAIFDGDKAPEYVQVKSNFTWAPK